MPLPRRASNGRPPAFTVAVAAATSLSRSNHRPWTICPPSRDPGKKCTTPPSRDSTDSFCLVLPFSRAQRSTFGTWTSWTSSRRLP
uniref:Putative secreted protein n=1 Tax=Ixodes ricinus TaxID=34613 RepID=A0A6B0U970_IXORI